LETKTGVARRAEGKQRVGPVMDVGDGFLIEITAHFRNCLCLVPAPLGRTVLKDGSVVWSLLHLPAAMQLRGDCIRCRQNALITINISASCCLQGGFREFVIGQLVEEIRYIVRPTITEIEIIAMLPDIKP